MTVKNFVGKKLWVWGLGEGLIVLSFLWTCVFADKSSFWGPRTTVPFAFTLKAFFNWSQNEAMILELSFHQIVIFVTWFYCCVKLKVTRDQMYDSNRLWIIYVLDTYMFNIYAECKNDYWYIILIHWYDQYISIYFLKNNHLGTSVIWGQGFRWCPLASFFGIAFTIFAFNN